MAQSFVQVAVDGVGKKIDNAAVVLPDGSTQYRQSIAVADPNFNANISSVTIGGDQRVQDLTLQDLMQQILVELRVMNTTLSATLNSQDDLDALRAQENLVTLQQTN